MYGTYRLHSMVYITVMVYVALRFRCFTLQYKELIIVKLPAIYVKKACDYNERLKLSLEVASEYCFYCHVLIVYIKSET